MGLFHMIGAKKKYGSVQTAMNTWRDYMVSMGFGYPLGVDLPGEKRAKDLLLDADISASSGFSSATLNLSLIHI